MDLSREMHSRALYAGIAGIATLYPLGRAPGWLKATTVVVPTALGAVVGGVLATNRDWSTPQRLAAGVGLPVWLAGTMALSIKADEVAEDWLSSRVRRPRWLMAGAAALLAAATPPSQDAAIRTSP